MPSTTTSRAPGIALRRGAAARRATSGSRAAVDDERWATSMRAQLRGAVAGGDDRGELARRAGGVVAAVEGAPGHLAQLGLVAREAGRADHARTA